MHFETRLWPFTEGVRLRILWAVLVGLVAVAFGVARLALLGWLIGAVFAAAAGWAVRAGPLFYPVLSLYGVHLYWQARRLRIDRPALALVLFKSNRSAGLLLLAAILAGLWRPASLGFGI